MWSIWSCDPLTKFQITVRFGCFERASASVFVFGSPIPKDTSKVEAI